MKYRLREYTATDETELRQRNLKQAEIWKMLVEKNIVEKNDTMRFYKFAKYFNDYRDEYGFDPSFKEVFAELGRFI